jgi:hypothetical protein
MSSSVVPQCIEFIGDHKSACSMWSRRIDMVASQALTFAFAATGVESSQEYPPLLCLEISHS